MKNFLKKSKMDDIEINILKKIITKFNVEIVNIVFNDEIIKKLKDDNI